MIKKTPKALKSLSKKVINLLIEMVSIKRRGHSKGRLLGESRERGFFKKQTKTNRGRGVMLFQTFVL